MDEITVNYLDLSDQDNPRSVRQAFYVDVAPTAMSIMIEWTPGFTMSGEPCRFRYLRFDRDDQAFYAARVEIQPPPPPRFAPPSPEPSRAAQPEPPAWPRSFCWSVLRVDRQALPLEPHRAREVVSRAFRQRALHLHPDRGGDPAQFRYLLYAKEVALALLSDAILV